MTKRDLAVLGCKILGIFIFTNNVPVFLTFIPFSVVTYMQGDFSAGDIVTSTIQILTLVLMMVCAAILWFQAKRIGQWVVPKDTPPTSFTLHENFIVAALLIIGIVLFVVSIPNPNLIKYFAEHLFAPQNNTALNSYNIRNLNEAYLQFILAIIIFGSSASISRLFRYSPKSTFVEQETQITKYDIAHLGCRLLGIYLIVINIVTLISQLGMLATIFWQKTSSPLPFMLAKQIEAIFYFVIIIAIGVWLWLGADFFARKLAGKNSFNAAAGLNLEMLPLMISFVGLMLLVKEVPGFINALSMHSILMYFIPEIDAGFRYSAIASGIKVLLGLLLLFAPETVSDKLQNMGYISTFTIASLRRWLKNPSGSNVNH